MSSNELTRRHAVIAGGLGALAVAGMAGSANAAGKDHTEAEKANIKLVRAFCHSWNDPEQSVKMLAADASVRMYFDKPPIIGASAVGEEMSKFMGLKDKVNVEIHKIFAEGPIVVTARTDTLTSPGKPDQVFKIVGVFCVRNGKIQEWADYNAA
jgi:limonene-1,2-epoxide hydrolase